MQVSLFAMQVLCLEILPCTFSVWNTFTTTSALPSILSSETIALFVFPLVALGIFYNYQETPIAIARKKQLL